MTDVEKRCGFCLRNPLRENDAGDRSVAVEVNFSITGQDALEPLENAGWRNYTVWRIFYFWQELEFGERRLVNPWNRPLRQRERHHKAYTNTGTPRPNPLDKPPPPLVNGQTTTLELPFEPVALEFGSIPILATED